MKLGLSLIICALFFQSADALLPAKVYLDVPFVCQAPEGNWSQPYQDACEEANLVMAMRFVQAKAQSRAQAKAEILSLVEFQIKHYGDYHSTTAAQTAQLIRDYYNYNNVTVTDEVSVEKIKQELNEGNLVIAPMAGQLLGNPYYTAPGPVYHMLLIKGYDDSTSEFITNDDGTRRGRSYRYQYLTIINAIHDWTGNPETIKQGAKVIIIISPRS